MEQKGSNQDPSSSVDRSSEWKLLPSIDGTDPTLLDSETRTVLRGIDRAVIRWPLIDSTWE